MEQIIAKGRRLVDSYGRERIFNGMNVCDKGRYVPEADKRVYGELWKKGTAKQLKQGGIEVNCSIETLVSMQRDRAAADVAAVLFE